jgi:hypothetical protein
MRRLPPLKAVSHALGSVATYRGVGIRLGVVWVLALWALGLAEILAASPRPAAAQVTAGDVLGLLSAAIGLIGFCSIAVGWHRFVLRDEVSGFLRVDAAVWRYLGNSILIMLAVLLPAGLLAVIVENLPPAASVLLLPAVVLAGTLALRLSIKLPAVALGRKDFGFRDALAATKADFWPLLGVFLLNGAIVLGGLLVLVVLVTVLEKADATLAAVAGLTAGMAFQLFYTLFNASIFTSLDGFFVEGREF